MTTRAVPSFTYATPTCTSFPRPFVTFEKNNLSSNWTSYHHTVLSNSTVTTIRFTIRNNNHNKIYIDSVDVKPISNASISLIVNGDFEQGNTVGWDKHNCDSWCNPAGNIVNSDMCRQKFCYFIASGCNNYQILQQSFYTIPDHQYVVSFDLVRLEQKTDGKGNGQHLDAQVAIV